MTVDADTRDAWVHAGIDDTRERLDAFETGDAEYGELATDEYCDDLAELEGAVEALAETES